MDILSGITDACDTVIDAASNLVSSTSRSRHDSKHKHVSTPRQRQRRRPHLPVLIIPGFMSSGLTVEKTHLLESWEGQSLKSLGLEKYYDTKASRERNRKRRQEDVMSMSMSETFENDDDDDEEEESDGEDLVPSRNLWIKHISLPPSDLKSDPAGGDIQVRPMEGLPGVDYLTPGTLTNFLSYVFALVIIALQKVGYKDGVNLDAAPYDWRLAPVELERRDMYFTNTMKKVEEMYETNCGMPVVLVCHSLGCRVAHYFLDFAHARDASWCSKYIHTFMPIGAPHLGAPFALRGVLCRPVHSNPKNTNIV